MTLGTVAPLAVTALMSLAAKFDTPIALLSNPRTLFHSMAMSAGGPKMVAELLEIAKK